MEPRRRWLVVVVGGEVLEGMAAKLVPCGLVETSAVTPRGPRSMITGGRDGDARPPCPFAEETAEVRSTGQVCTGPAFNFVYFYCCPV